MIFKKIVLIVAMEAEAKPIIDVLKLSKDLSFCPLMPMTSWIGKYKECRLSLVINGQDPDTGMDLIGTQSATLATQFAIDKYQPDVIINAGTAGAFGENGSQIGDVYLSHNYVVFHDRRVPIPGWDKQGIGYYKVWDVSSIVDLGGFKTGIVTTGNSLDMSTEDEKNIRLLNGEVKDMEAAAVAWVAKLHSIPMFCAKAVTDLMDSGNPTHEEFEQNLELATHNLRDGLVRIINFLAG